MTTPSSWCVRPADHRFHSQSTWLDSWHSFSFAGHHHPDWMGFGPLRVINDDVIAAGHGFGMHPHRDMEIITVMVEGQLNHRDSMGNSGVIRAGDVQRMTAGTGIVHSEINAGSTPCRLLQIWIEPSAQKLTPDYEQRSIAVASDWTPLIADHPEDGQDTMRIARPVRLWRAQPAMDQQLSLPATPHSLGWIQVIQGSIALTGHHTLSHTMQRGDGLGWPEGPECPESITGQSDDADVLLFSMN